MIVIINNVDIKSPIRPGNDKGTLRLIIDLDEHKLKMLHLQ